MEHVKEAFSKVKQDIDSLKKEVSYLSEGLKETRQRLIEICDILKTIARNSEDSFKKNKPSTDKFSSSINPTDNSDNPNKYSSSPPSPTQASENPTHTSNNTTNPTHNLPYNPLKGENLVISTGNEGVPADRQTNQQTNQQTDKDSYNQGNNPFLNQSTNSIDHAAKILDSLDNLKKEVRLKFKRLTEQEFSVFSTIYQLSEENQNTDYKNLSIKLGLTESSIRDYVGRLIKKGIPVEKTKINNKTVQLSISQNLKKIASLPTILQLRAI